MHFSMFLIKQNLRLLWNYRIVSQLFNKQLRVWCKKKTPRKWDNVFVYHEFRKQTNGDSISKDKRTLEEGDDDEMDQSDLNFKRTRIDDTNTER